MLSMSIAAITWGPENLQLDTTDVDVLLRDPLVVEAGYQAVSQPYTNTMPVQNNQAFVDALTIVLSRNCRIIIQLELKLNPLKLDLHMAACAKPPY